MYVRMGEEGMDQLRRLASWNRRFESLAWDDMSLVTALVATRLLKSNC